MIIRRPRLPWPTERVIAAVIGAVLLGVVVGALLRMPEPVAERVVVVRVDDH